METKTYSLAGKILGTLAIPVTATAILLILCVVGGTSIFGSAAAFNIFVVYTAVVMITTMALSINLNSGRFDFSLGTMAVLSAVIGAKLTYTMTGGAGNAFLMPVICAAAGALFGFLSGVLYVLLKIPPIITSLGVTLIMEGITYTITAEKYVMTEVQNDSMAALRLRHRIFLKKHMQEVYIFPLLFLNES